MDRAIDQGWSWSRVAGALGVSKQTAHRKHARRVAARGERPPERAKLLVTGQARRSVHFARQEAARLGHASTGTDHLLLGLLRDDHGPAVRALESVGVSLAAGRRQAVRRRLGQTRAGAAQATVGQGRVPVSAEGRAAFEQSLREAVARHDGRLGVEHILFALLHEEGGAARAMLRELGFEAERVERRLEELLGERPPGEAASERPSEAGQDPPASRPSGPS